MNMDMDHGGIGTFECRWDEIINFFLLVAAGMKGQRWQCRLQFVGALVKPVMKPQDSKF